MKIPLLIIATLFVASCQAYRGINDDYQTYPLRMKTGNSGLGIKFPTEVYCASWRLVVEQHNLRNFEAIPDACKESVGNYLESDQYRSDSKQTCIQAYYHALEVELGKDGKDIFVFEVEDTAISSIPFNSGNGFGEFNSTAWNEYVNLASSPALPETRKLYGKILSLGIKPVFLTRRYDSQAAVTANNLKSAGFHSWEKLITKSADEYKGKTSEEYKRAERQKLVDEGYRIVGTIGDQWSDILGENVGRSFKLPNPMYYKA